MFEMESYQWGHFNHRSYCGVFLGSTGGDESLPSMDTEEKAAVKLNFRPLLPEDDEDEDVPDMDACGDDNLVETSVSVNIVVEHFLNKDIVDLI